MPSLTTSTTTSSEASTSPGYSPEGVQHYLLHEPSLQHQHAAPAAWATADDWVVYRPIITRHYRDDNMKLKELIVFMEKTYRFRATAKMYKDRLTKWRISKNVKASDIRTIVGADQPCSTTATTTTCVEAPAGSDSPAFYVVGDRLIRSDRLQQAMQRRANVARRALKPHGKRKSHSPPVKQSPSPPLALTSPIALLLPERILSCSHAYLSSALSSPPTVARMRTQGPVQRLWVAFEHALYTLSPPQPGASGLPHVAFQHLDGAFSLVRTCLRDRSPQFLAVLLQMLSLCLAMDRPEILRLLSQYVAELAAVMLPGGAGHPLAQLARDLAASSDGGAGEIVGVVAAAAWGLYHRAQVRQGVLVQLVAAYADTLDSLGNYSDAERFLRDVVDGGQGQLQGVGHMHAELQLCTNLRRVGKHSEAVGRLGRLGEEVRVGDDGGEEMAEVLYEVLRIRGSVACDVGNVDEARVWHAEAFEFIEAKTGRSSARTIMALRNVLRVCRPEEEEALQRQLEDRLAEGSECVEESDADVTMVTVEC